MTGPLSRASCLHPMALPCLWARPFLSCVGRSVAWPPMSPLQCICLALTYHLEKAVKHNNIQKVVMRASRGSPKDILGYVEDEVVPAT